MNNYFKVLLGLLLLIIAGLGFYGYQVHEDLTEVKDDLKRNKATLSGVKACYKLSDQMVDVLYEQNDLIGEVYEVLNENYSSAYYLPVSVEDAIDENILQYNLLAGTYDHQVERYNSECAVGATSGS